MRIKSQKSNDPSFHRENLRAWLDKKTEQNPPAGANLRRFVGELLKIFSDNPPNSWRFRITKYRNPVFRVHRVTTGNINDFLIVGSKRLIILHKFFDEQFRGLFEKSNDFYGIGDGAPIDFTRFGEKEQTPYLEAIKSMAKDHPDWYIRRLTKKQGSVNPRSHPRGHHLAFFNLPSEPSERHGQVPRLPPPAIICSI